jgi:hypothetical protein
VILLGTHSYARRHVERDENRQAFGVIHPISANIGTLGEARYARSLERGYFD